MPLLHHFRRTLEWGCQHQVRLPGSCHLDPRSFEVADHSPKAKIELAEIEKLCAMPATDKEIASVFGFNTNTGERRRKVQRSAT